MPRDEAVDEGIEALEDEAIRDSCEAFFSENLKESLACLRGKVEAPELKTFLSLSLLGNFRGRNIKDLFAWESGYIEYIGQGDITHTYQWRNHGKVIDESHN